MAWHKKGLSKEEKKHADIFVAKGLLQIAAIEKGDMSARDNLTIIGKALEILALHYDEKVSHEMQGM